MQAVGELDEDHPQVVGRGHRHLLEVLGLGLLVRLEDGGELADPVHDLGDLPAEDRLELGLGGAGVLEDVVQQRRGDGPVVHAHLGQDVGYRQRVRDVVVARAALLPVVGGAGEFIGPPNASNLGLGQVAAEGLRQGFERCGGGNRVGRRGGGETSLEIRLKCR